MKKLILIVWILSIYSCGYTHKKRMDKPYYKNIMITSSGKARLGPCEPSIVINPKDTQNVVAGTVLNQYHYSFDGGLTWTTETLKSTYGVYGDPCIVADYMGNFYYMHLSNPSGNGWKDDDILDRMVVQKSVDGGKTWSNGSFYGLNPPKDQDKEWACVNPNNNEIYATWTQFDKYGSKKPEDKSNIMFSKSSDGGITWTEALRINEYSGNCIDSDRTTEGAVPAIGLNNEIYVAWSYDSKIYFDISVDAGKTWLDKDMIITEQKGGWDLHIPGMGRSNGMPVTGTDLSNSKYKGTIYVNWADQRYGENNTDIWIAKSTDRGNTWSIPIKVNQDQTQTHQFFTWMSIDPKTGHIYIVYYDRSKYNDMRTDVVLATSIDGGNTWTNETISEKPFGAVPKGVFFGDYNNISAYDGVIRPIWTRIDGEKLSVYTAIINKKN